MTAQRAARRYGVGLVALFAVACGATEKDGGPAAPDEVPPIESGGAAGAAQTPDGAGAPACDTLRLGPSTLLRLSRFQLARTLRDLFQDVPAVAALAERDVQQLPAELDPFANGGLSSAALAPQRIEVEAYYRLAQALALRLSEDEQVQSFIGCEPSTGQEVACRDQFIAGFLQRSYRRLPSEEEQSQMQAVFARGQELGGDFVSGVRAVVEVVLQGPDFLYLIERGTGEPEDGIVALSGYETAARIAYVLTGSAPDPELRAAAEGGPLTADEVEAHARRLLGGAGSRDVVSRFMFELLRLGLVVGQSAPDSPSYTGQIAALTRRETAHFIEEVVFDGAGTFQALFAQPSTWLNGPLAQFYGVPGVSGDDFRKVELTDGRRAGILTQSAFLALPSGRTFISPVPRGMTVLQRVLCVQPPPPPPNIDVVLPVDPPVELPWRQRFEATTQPLACQECHRDIDPIGFAFDNYDSVGLWRDTVGGLPIDASGTLYKTDAQGSFENAVQLVQRIAESEDAKRCFAGNWLTYAYGRWTSPADACALEQIETALLDSGGNITEMLVALAKLDQFRYRLASELAP